MLGNNDNWNSLPKPVRACIVAGFSILAAVGLWLTNQYIGVWDAMMGK